MFCRFTRHAAFVLLLIGFSSSAVVRAQGIGVSAGPNFSELGDIRTTDGDATLDNVTGWHIHLWFDLPVGPVALRPGLRYMEAGRLLEPTSTSGFENAGPGASVEDDQFFTFMEVPVDLRLRMSLPLITPYVMAGPVIRFTTDQNNQGQLERFSLAAGAGAGFEIGLGGIRLYPELKYTFGVTRFMKESYELGDVTVTPDDDQRLNSVMLSLGISL
ncbi:MAG: PorT family protein [Rhodothermales bacterium]